MVMLYSLSEVLWSCYILLGEVLWSCYIHLVKFMVMLYSLGEVLWSCYILLVKFYGHVIFSWWSFM